MINQQLVDYIKQQLQAGASEDAVSKALADAGWPLADVQDSIKAAAPAAPAASANMIDPVAAMGGADAAMSSASASSEKFFARPSDAAAQPAVGDDDESEHPAVKKFVVAMSVMGVVILLLAGSLAFVYFNLNGQLDAARNGGSGASGQMAALQGQVSQLTAERDALVEQVSQLTAERNMLLDEVGFFAAPADAASAAPVAATIKGTLSGSASTTFALMTPHDVRIIVANSQDAAVAAALAPLVGGESQVELAGTHPPASPNLTVTAVNGAAL